MTVLASFPRFRAFDVDGNPLSGGLLYSYQPGTSTPKATYTDSSYDTANANPVELDVNGEADVWLLGAYKFILTDSDDVLQGTVDNYPILDATVQAETTLTPTAGQATATWAGVPQGARLKGVTVRVTTALGTSQAMTAFHVGISFDGNLLVDAYGRDIALALNTTTTGASFTSSDQPIPTTAAGSIVLTAVNGLFDGTGAVKIRVTYETYAAP